MARSTKALRRTPGQLYSNREFRRLGGRYLAYIRTMSSEEAQERFPSMEKLPRGLLLYALQRADGTTIALADTRQAAYEHAKGDDLEVAAVH